MSDKIVRMLPAAKRKRSPSGGLCELASAAAPFVYFDRAPIFGFNGAVANIPSKRCALRHRSKVRRSWPTG